MSKYKTVFVPRAQKLTITADSFTSGNYGRKAQPGDSTSYGLTSISASSSATVGPFDEPREYILISDNGELTYSLANDGIFDSSTVSDTELGYLDGVTSAIQTQLNDKKPVTPASNAGTAATNVSAAEYGDDFNKTTVLTVTNAVLPDIGGAVDEAEGVLLYTLPAGACVVNKAYMSMAIQQQDGNITADTPDVGLGTDQASGGQSLLSALGNNSEAILTGQTAADCDGTATVKTVADQVFVIESADNHTIYFNVADTWAAGGDSGALVSGTVVLHWQFMN